MGAVSLTRTEGEPHVTHTLKSPLARGTLTINLRAEADPEDLKHEIRRAVSTLAPITAKLGEINAFRPGRPNPTHRMATCDA